MLTANEIKFQRRNVFVTIIYANAALTTTFLNNMVIFIYTPLRKQCQAVVGQEWDQAMSSSSEKEEDIEKTPDSDSLLACCMLFKNTQTC